MEIYYEGKDITGSVIPRMATHRDASHGKADVLEIAFRRAAAWHRWDPQIGEKIRVYHEGYDTGTLYIDTIVPEGDSYRIIASSTPAGAKRRAWATYTNAALETIMHRCAVESGMEESLYGIDKAIKYPYLIRENEGHAAFLAGICEREGAAMKTYNGRFMAVGLEYIQNLPVQIGMEITPGQDGCRYIHQPGSKYYTLTIRTPKATATATDESAADGQRVTLGTIPATDTAAAGRWARGLLLHHNRKADSLMVESRFRADATALVRVTVEGGTGADGEWIIDEAEHDFFNERTKVKMLRVIDSIR